MIIKLIKFHLMFVVLELHFLRIYSHNKKNTRYSWKLFSDCFIISHCVIVKAESEN